MNHETNEEENGLQKNADKIIALDLVFAFLTYLIGLSMNRLLGIIGASGNTEGPWNLNLALILSTSIFFYFVLIDGLLILNKNLDRRILFFSGILIFLLLAMELVSISSWFLFFYKNSLKTAADLEADRIYGLERMGSGMYGIFPGVLFAFQIGKIIVRVIWNSFWVRAILAKQKVSDSSLN
ncbi:hypothetical protein [Leptospira stimsonii]|uniref:Uncharacterized protein n=1 Tax=Leptospira stimsonii TaxID=2202203 RepID=A0A396Z172_9LEPT|nr:hypothetical protein [Leptospira stimsonii]RHX87267.1 hypothetical protein DLM75_17330 [Leptospira stimsonii]